MNALLFVPYYARWHYTRGLRDFFSTWHNFLWFVAEFFSLHLLAKTLFSPWHRLRESYKEGFDPAKWGAAFIVNFLMRLVGFVVRFLVLLIGFASLIFVFILGVLSLFIWIFLPFITLFLLAIGLGKFV